MKRFIIGAAVITAIAFRMYVPAMADEKDASAIIDKAIKALGGADKLGKINAASWKAKGTLSFGGNDIQFNSMWVVEGLQNTHQEFEGEFMGNKFSGKTVVAGDKGWRNFAGMSMELDKDAMANEKRLLYLAVIPMTVLPLKSKDYKLEVTESDKPMVGINVTGPDGKDFMIYFDKESGLPVKTVAKVLGFMGEEFTQEATFSEFKEIGGIKKATKFEFKRDGEKYLVQEISDFKVLDKVDPKLFEEPK